MQQHKEKSELRKIRKKEPAPLVFHIARHRQWYGDHGMKQGDLSELTGIERKKLTKYETTGALPEVVNDLLSIALAFDLSIEELIAPWIVDTRRAEIETRRTEMGLDHDIGYRDRDHAH